MTSPSDDDDRKKNRYYFDRHTPEYREQFDTITEEMQSKCPMAWTDVYNGHWVAADSKHVFELARCPAVSNHHDLTGETPYQGITIPKAQRATVVRGGILEMDEPEHSTYRGALNPYLSPAAIKRWQPFVDEIVRASLDEKIESGRIDFVDDLANIVPAVLTLAMMGIELKKWPVYSEPAHLSVSTPEHSPDAPRVADMNRQMGIDMINTMMEVRENSAAGPDQRAAATADRRRARARPGDPRQPGADHRRRLRHHHRPHRTLAGVAVGESRPARAAQPRARHPAEPRHRGVPALLHPRARATAAPSPRMSRSRARSSRRANGSGSPGQWPIATRRCSTSPTRSSWTEKATGTSASASACTAAWVPTSPAPCSSRC